MPAKKTYLETKCKVSFPAWDYSVNIVFTTNVDNSVYRRDKNHDRNGATAGICMRSTSGHPSSLIILPYWPRTSLVAHESWHAVKNMLDYCGASYDSETVAYHLGYLVREIESLCRKHPRPKKSKPRSASTGNGQ